MIKDRAKCMGKYKDKDRIIAEKKTITRNGTKKRKRKMKGQEV